MKKTIITLASVATLAGAANAQIYSKDSWDFSTIDYTAVTSSAGQNFDVLGTGEFIINLKATGTNLPTNIIPVSGNVGWIGGSNTEITFTFATVQNTGYNVQGLSMAFVPGSADEEVTFHLPGWTQDLGFNNWVADTSSPENDFLGVGSENASGWWNIGAGNTPVWSVNFANGGNSGNNFLIRSALPVPEPSSTALLGLGGLALLLRRKK